MAFYLERSFQTVTLYTFHEGLIRVQLNRNALLRLPGTLATTYDENNYALHGGLAVSTHSVIACSSAA